MITVLDTDIIERMDGAQAQWLETQLKQSADTYNHRNFANYANFLI